MLALYLLRFVIGFSFPYPAPPSALDLKVNPSFQSVPATGWDKLHSEEVGVELQADRRLWTGGLMKLLGEVG